MPLISYFGAWLAVLPFTGMPMVAVSPVWGVGFHVSELGFFLMVLDGLVHRFR